MIEKSGCKRRCSESPDADGSCGADTGGVGGSRDDNTAVSDVDQSFNGKRTKRRRAGTKKPTKDSKGTDDKLVINDDNILVWFRYIAERQRIFFKWLRQDSSLPWSEDPVMCAGRLCNDFRFLDRESVWVIANIIRPLRDRPVDLILNLIIFRCYTNWHLVMEHVGLQSAHGFDAEQFVQKLRTAHSMYGKISSAAYLISPFEICRDADRNDEMSNGDESGSANKAGCAKTGGAGGKTTKKTPKPKGPPGGVKIRRFSTLLQDHIIPLLADTVKAITERKDSEFTFEMMNKLPGLCEFPVWQTCIDIGYWDSSVYDESRHVLVGPGAINGLGYLFKSRGALSYSECVQYLVTHQRKFLREAGISESEESELFGSMPTPPGHNTATKGYLDLMTLENCLCEGSKYFRNREGSGKFKQKYDPFKATRNAAGQKKPGADEKYLRDYRIMLDELKRSWGRDQK